MVLRGRPAQAADLISHRLKSLEAICHGTHRSIAQKLEIPQPDQATIAQRKELQVAQEESYQDAKGVKGGDSKGVKGDFCQFGTPWRKPTLFMCAHVDPTELHRLSKTCSGPRGQCSRTRVPLFLLSGSCRDGRRWTQVAQPYPRRLCVALAHSLTSASHLISAHKFF